MKLVNFPRLFVFASIFSFALVAYGEFNTAEAANPCNPCAANPCAANPCAANPCAANPCAANPCAANPCAANPCAANPCAGAKVDANLVTRPAGTSLAKGDVKLGEKLFKDTGLSTNGMSCQTCHEDNAAFEASFAKPYPHKVAMAAVQGGVTSIDLDEMVQFCLVVPMETKPLPWDSKELAALTAYTAELQKSFMANPCAGKNPCGNPCGNPCAGKNPCANPCANPCGNPCAGKNPCANPCGNPCAANPCAANPCGNPCG